MEAEFDVALGEPYAIDAERLPRVTEIIEHFGERWGDPRHWVGLYGYLCGTANHPSLNAYEYLDLADPTAHPPRLSIELLSRLLRPVMVSYLKALEATTSYMGLPDEPTHHLIDRVNAVLGPTLIEPTLGRL